MMVACLLPGCLSPNAMQPTLHAVAIVAFHISDTTHRLLQSELPLQPQPINEPFVAGALADWILAARLYIMNGNY
jgi:hypothetical protein